jgi:hypothetical protein
MSEQPPDSPDKWEMPKSPPLERAEIPRQPKKEKRKWKFWMKAEQEVSPDSNLSNIADVFNNFEGTDALLVMQVPEGVIAPENYTHVKITAHKALESSLSSTAYVEFVEDPSKPPTQNPNKIGYTIMRRAVVVRNLERQFVAPVVYDTIVTPENSANARILTEKDHEAVEKLRLIATKFDENGGFNQKN